MRKFVKFAVVVVAFAFIPMLAVAQQITLAHTITGMPLDLSLSPDWPRPSGAQVAAIRMSLHGSLAYTGVGHGSDRAVVLGLVPCVMSPETFSVGCA